MKKPVMAVIVPVLIGGIFCYCNSAFAEHTGTGVYTNEDLEKYRTPGDTVVESAPNVPDEIADEKKPEVMETQPGENPVPPVVPPPQNNYRGKEAPRPPR